MKARAPVFFLTGVSAALAFGWLGFPHLRYAGADQPLQFSHETHTREAVGLGCQDCHAFRADGAFVGIPSVANCGNCHAEPIGSSAEERRLVDEFIKPGREIAWHVYARQPDNVHFPHAQHVTTAALPCERCHAGHGKSASLPAFQSDRISGYARGLATMDECERCHRETGRGATACIGCHK